MRRLEEYSEQFGISKLTLMEKAGKAVAAFIALKRDPSRHIVIIFCGPGNNGGDGFVAARYLSKKTMVFVLFYGTEERLSPEAAAQLSRIQENPCIAIIRQHDMTPPSIQRLKKALHQEKIILIDALLGTGFKGVVREPIRSAILLYNSLKGYKVSVDIPSGIHPDTGEAANVSALANDIITFHDIKPCLKARKRVVVAQIGIPKQAVTLLKQEIRQQFITTFKKKQQNNSP